MYRIKKYLLHFVLLPVIFYLPVQRSSGQVSVSAFASQNMILQDELIKLQFIIENAYEVQQFIPPSFTGCKVVEGPMHTSGTSVVNGLVNNYVAFVYVIQPEAPGEYALSGGAVIVNDRRFNFNSIRFKVIEYQHNNNRYSFQNQSYDAAVEQHLYHDYVIRKDEDIHNKIRQNLFIRVDINKNHCYEGEPVVATYKLYSRLHAETKVSKWPSFNGFSVCDMVEPSSVPVTVETYNGKEFNVYLIRKAQLFPLQSGTLELDPAEVENDVSFLKAEAIGKNREAYFPELLRSFESGNIAREAIVTDHVSIKSDPLPVTVKSLPVSSRPSSFDGAVGSFSIEATIDKNEIALDDMATVRVIIKGEGNFGVINAPPVLWPTELDAYEPEIRENILKHVAPMRGYKTFVYTVMPKRTGVMVIPPVEFSYFDPKSDQYTTAKTDAIIIHAVSEVPAKSSAGADMMITTASEVPKTPGNRWLWISAAFVVLGLSGFFLFRYFRFQRAAPGIRGTEQEYKVQAHREDVQTDVLSNPLFRAKLMLIQQNGQGFYAELGKALSNYMNEKLQLTGTYSDKKDIIDRMKTRGVDDIMITQFQLLIQQCEMALYTPVVNETEMQSVYDLAEDLLDNMSKTG